MTTKQGIEIIINAIKKIAKHLQKKKCLNPVTVNYMNEVLKKIYSPDKILEMSEKMSDQIRKINRP